MVLSTSYLPPSAWFRAIEHGAPIEAYENFQKQTPRNRATILTANGPLNLVVPYVHQSGRNIPIKEVRIDYTEPWQRTHQRAIEAAYRSAPFWEHFAEQIVPLFQGNETFLWDLNLSGAERLLNILKIEAKITQTDHFIGAQEPPMIEVPYMQVFADRIPFTSGLSVLDSIFCQARLPNEE